MEKSFISLIVKCPHCNHSLMDCSKLIRGMPSIRLFVRSGRNGGMLNICSLYGCFDKCSEINISDGEITELLCPVCKKSLQSKSVCDICGAPVFILSLETGGKLQTCSRVNCKKHKVIFEDIYKDLTRYFLIHDYSER